MKEKNIINYVALYQKKKKRFRGYLVTSVSQKCCTHFTLDVAMNIFELTDQSLYKKMMNINYHKYNQWRVILLLTKTRYIQL
jgi:hypothetical protein